MYKIIENDPLVLEDELVKIQSVNHLLPFRLCLLNNGKYLIILTPIWKNSIRYHYFEKTYKPETKASIYILGRNITDYLI